MAAKNGWTRDQLLIAFNLYCQMPFGQMDSRNPDIIRYAAIIGRTPSALAMKLLNIAGCDPAITSTGRVGLKRSSNADRIMWEEMQADWDKFANEMQQAVNSFEIRELPMDLDDTTEMDKAVEYSGNDKVIQTTTRIGQNFFRRSVLSAYEYRCCMTGLSVTKLLVASQIVPWRVDEANRLNPSNGLCLSMLHDKAFDSGILTITEDMSIRVSQKYTEHADPFFDAALLAYEGKTIFQPEKFRPYAEFLNYHRQNVFQE